MTTTASTQNSTQLPTQNPTQLLAQNPTQLLAPIASVDTWPPLREMPADVSQRVFHVLMEAFSRPGTMHRLPKDAFLPPVPAAVAPLLALADLMTPITGLDEGGVAVTTAIARLTGAPVAPADTARFALALGDPGDFRHLNQGSHWSPEAGATLVQRVAAVDLVDVPTTATASSATASSSSAAAPASGDWRLSGPGVPPHEDRIVRVSGLSGAWLPVRQALTADYPAGIDCLLITDEGTLIALSRTTIIEVI